MNAFRRLSFTTAGIWCLTIGLAATTTLSSSASQIFPRLRRGPRAESVQKPQAETNCNSALNVSFHIKRFSSGLRAALWYPTTAAEGRYVYPGQFETTMATDAPAAACSRYPLIVFSHGFGGCSVQSLFFAEALARTGYIVVAPDHRDANCKVDQPLGGNLLRRAEVPFLKPRDWSDSTYRDRMEDIRLILDEIVRDSRVGPRIDASRIGVAGHSLGGYTVLGMAGGWPSWKDNRIKAALLMSPYVAPYVVSGTLPKVQVPLMYQGGTRDNRVTPEIRKKAGAYDLSSRPKYYVEFEGARHLDWSNLTCAGRKFIPACSKEAPQARLIIEYAEAFFDRYLKNRATPLLNRSNGGVADFRHDE